MSTKAQNLVPNSSFEEYNECPNTFSSFNEYVSIWYNPTAQSPDYYNACSDSGTNNMGVPVNDAGYQPARTGCAYGAVGLYVSPNPINASPREYIAVKLAEPLQEDTVYCASFFLSLCNNLQGTSVADVGMYFSVDSIFQNILDTLGYAPQVYNDHNTLLQDTANWMEVSGSFQSQGGEQYIIIGNFLANNQTNAVLNGPLPYQAYYYIDDVSVMKCSQWNSVTDLVERSKQPSSVYPNPANNTATLTFDFNQSKNYRLQLTDLVGRVLYDDAISEERFSFDVSAFRNGAYLVRLFEDGRMVENAKLLVLR